MTVFRRILVATDFSDASASAVELAVKLATSSGAQLLAAHVYDEPRLPDLSFAHVRLYEEFEKKVKDDAARHSRNSPLGPARRAWKRRRSSSEVSQTRPSFRLPAITGRTSF